MASSFSVRYIFEMVDRFTPGATKLAGAVKTIGAASVGAAAGVYQLGAAIAKMSAAAAGVKMFKSGLDAAARFEDKMAEVRKVVPDMTKATMWELAKDVQRLSVKWAVPADQVADIYAGAARMGIRGKDALNQFAETVVKVASAWDGVSASMAAENLATISGKFFNNLAPLEAQKRMIGVADAINYLAQNTPGVKNAELLKFFQNAGPIAASLGLTAEELSAYGAVAMMTGKSGGLEEGTRGNMSLQRMMLAATGKTQGPRGETNLGKAFKTLGMSQRQWAAMLKASPQDAVLTLMERMQGMDNLGRTKFLKDFLGDARAARQLTAMSGQLNEYKRALAEVSDKYAQRFVQEQAFMAWMDQAYPAQAAALRQLGTALHYGSVDQEAKTRIDTYIKQMDRLKMAMEALKINLFQPFLSPATDGIERLVGGIEKIRNLGLDSGLSKSLAVGGLVAGIGAVTAAALAGAAALTGFAGPLSMLAAMAPIVITITLAAGAIAAIHYVSENWDRLRAAFAEPLKINILFPQMPEWLKWAFEQNAETNRRLEERIYGPVGTPGNDNRPGLMQWLMKKWEEWTTNLPPIPDAAYGMVGRNKAAAAAGEAMLPHEQYGYPSWGAMANAIPQSMSVSTRVEPITFQPANLNVNVTGTVNGPVTGTGTGQIQANESRGTSTATVGGGTVGGIGQLGNPNRM